MERKTSFLRALTELFARGDEIERFKQIESLLIL
jgi:hypothetical protein